MRILFFGFITITVLLNSACETKTGTSDKVPDVIKETKQVNSRNKIETNIPKKKRNFLDYFQPYEYDLLHFKIQSDVEQANYSNMFMITHSSPVSLKDSLPESSKDSIEAYGLTKTKLAKNQHLLSLIYHNGTDFVIYGLIYQDSTQEILKVENIARTFSDSTYQYATESIIKILDTNMLIKQLSTKCLKKKKASCSYTSKTRQFDLKNNQNKAIKSNHPTVEKAFANFIDMEHDSTQLQLKFEDISKNDFEYYKSNYKTKIRFDSSKIIGDSCFLKTTKETHSFEVCENCYRNWYAGTIEPLNIFIVGRIGEGVGDLQLIDSLSGRVFYLRGNFDDVPSLPYLSEDRSKFLTGSSTVFRQASEYMIYLRSEYPLIFKNILSYYTEAWETNDVVWVDNQSFAIKASKSASEEKIDTFFLKATILNDL